MLGGTWGLGKGWGATHAALCLMEGWLMIGRSLVLREESFLFLFFVFLQRGCCGVHHLAAVTNCWHVVGGWSWESKSSDVSQADRKQNWEPEIKAVSLQSTAGTGGARTIFLFLDMIFYCTKIRDQSCTWSNKSRWHFIILKLLLCWCIFKMANNSKILLYYSCFLNDIHPKKV